MIVSRVVSLVLRIAQFICAAVVLGLTAYFLHQRNSYGAVVPFGRTVYAIIWAALSIIAAVIWAIPTTSSMTGYVADLVFTAGWAAAFALLVRWFNADNCGSAWNWHGISLRRSNHCGQWKAAQAFSFLSMIFWFATFVLGLLVVHRLSRRAAARGSRV